MNNEVQKLRMQEEVLTGRPVRTFEIIDCHGHIGYWHHFHIPYRNAEDVVRLMDLCGISAIVISAHAAIGPDYKLGNKQVLDAMSRFPDRIYGYCTVNPHASREELLDELKRCFDAGMVAIKLHPSVHRARADSEGYSPAWEFAHEHGLCVLSHTAVSDPYCSVGMFDQIAGNYSNAKVLVGHCGFGYEGARQSCELARKHSNVYLDVTSSTFYTGLLERVVEGAGADRVLFGTDCPFMDCRPQVGRFAFSKLSDEELRLSLAENARRLFGIRA